MALQENSFEVRAG